MNHLDALSRVLDVFDVDLYTERTNGQTVFVGRLWDQGDVIADCRELTLDDLFHALDRSARAIISKECE